MQKKKTQPVEVLAPRTRATTPIAILKAVVKAIREEPKRYDQSDWVETWTPRTTKRYGEPKPESFPTCGTIGCVAGWVATLTRPKRERYTRSSMVERRARKALKLDQYEAGVLFEGDAVHGNVGTREYVERGVAHIERFMREHMGYKGPKL